MADIKDRPTWLFHGTPHSDLAELCPPPGGVLYASDDIRLAVTFLSKPEYFDCYRVDDRVYSFMAEKREDFVKRDRGGTVYIVDSAGFSPHPPAAPPGRFWEWTTSERVRPLMSIRYTSGLAAMMAHGVRVYFVDMHTFGRLGTIHDRYYLSKVMPSENMTFSQFLAGTGAVRGA